MSHWENKGISDEWYTPKYIFESLGVEFDLDVAHPNQKTFVPAKRCITKDSLSKVWEGFIWMNPPFGGRNGIVPWLNRFFIHGCGIALTPDRTSALWFQDALRKCDAVLYVKGKIKFIKPDGSLGKQPSNGTALFASGEKAVKALIKAAENGLGTVNFPYKSTHQAVLKN